MTFRHVDASGWSGQEVRASGLFSASSGVSLSFCGCARCTCSGPRFGLSSILPSLIAWLFGWHVLIIQPDSPQSFPIKLLRSMVFHQLSPATWRHDHHRSHRLRRPTTVRRDDQHQRWRPMLQVQQVHGQDAGTNVGTPASSLSRRRRIWTCRDVLVARGAQEGGAPEGVRPPTPHRQRSEPDERERDPARRPVVHAPGRRALARMSAGAIRRARCGAILSQLLDGRAVAAQLLRSRGCVRFDHDHLGCARRPLEAGPGILLACKTTRTRDVFFFSAVWQGTA